jgi:hypothetical protein
MLSIIEPVLVFIGLKEQVTGAVISGVIKGLLCFLKGLLCLLKAGSGNGDRACTLVTLFDDSGVETAGYCLICVLCGCFLSHCSLPFQRHRAYSLALLDLLRVRAVRELDRLLLLLLFHHFFFFCRIALPLRI